VIKGGVGVVVLLGKAGGAGAPPQTGEMPRGGWWKVARTTRATRAATGWKDPAFARRLVRRSGSFSAEGTCGTCHVAVCRQSPIKAAGPGVELRIRVLGY
jgi:hypothetical protein